MKVYTFRSKEDLYEAVAGIIAGVVQDKGDATLGLATGGTPIGIYARLVDMVKQGRLSFRHTTIFNLDEYVGLPVDHPESYHSYMRKHLLDWIDADPARCHIPNGTAPDLQAECARYDSLLNEVKQLDLQLLGIGHNGHIGFNEPSPELLSETHLVSLDEATRKANARYFSSIDEVPLQAITMGIGTIMKARKVLLTAHGADKASILKQSLNGPIKTEIPASILQIHPDLIVMLDESAAQELEPSRKLSDSETRMC
jgi:glucosamine-6-phosphate deaminase